MIKEKIITLEHDKPCTLHQMLKYAEANFLNQCQTMGVKSFKISIVTDTPHESVGKIMDDFFRERYPYPGAILDDGDKKRLLMEYILVYQAVTGNTITLNDIWFCRNFNKFSLDIGSSYILKQMASDTNTTVTRVPTPKGTKEEMKETLINFIKGVADDGVIDLYEYCTYAVYVIYHFLCSIDPDHMYRYLIFNHKYDVNTCAQSMFTCPVDSIVNQEQTLIQAYMQLNKAFNRNDIPYEFIPIGSIESSMACWSLRVISTNEH